MRPLIAALPIVALAACAPPRFADAPTESIDVQGRSVDVQVLEVAENDFDVRIVDYNLRFIADTTKDRRDFVDAALRSIEPRCSEGTKPRLVDAHQHNSETGVIARIRCES